MTNADSGSSAGKKNLARALAQFDELVELADAERAKRLAQLSESEPDLAIAVNKLLRADADQSGVLDHGVDGIAHTLLTELDVAEPSSGGLAAGSQVAAFALVRQLGSGGMGEVWLAQRRDGKLTQDVALKLLKRGMDSDEIARRFNRERRILAELNHPHIASFIDGGVSQEGRLYYAMEYVDGLPITDYAKRQALGVRARVQLLVSICEAVAYAQSHLVVHRDLKPSNILIDVSGQPRVLDFGIAKLVGVSVNETEVTASGLRLLSPAYAAPEQVLDEPISTATDVYSLGVIAFELLVGALPHSRSGSLVVLAEQVQGEITQAPSAAIRHAAAQAGAVTAGSTSPRVAREVSGDLDVIVLTALRRDPRRRYINAAALADDLKRWLDGLPIAAQADTTAYRLRKFVARNRWAVGSASAVLLALLAGFGVALWQAGVARDQARRAQIELQRAETIKAFTQSLFKEQDPFARSTAAARTPSELIARGIERAREQFADDALLRNELLEDLASIQLLLGEFEPAEATLADVLASRSRIDASAAERARVMSLHANALGGLGRFEQALDEAREAAETLRREQGADHPESIRADARWLRLWLPTGTVDELSKLAADVLERASRVFGESAPETLVIIADRTSVQERFDQYDAMQNTLQDLVARIERDLGSEHSLLARPLARLGDLQRVLGNNAAAQPYFDRAIAIARANALGPFTGALLMRRGDNFRRLQQNDAARRDFDESATLLRTGSAEMAQLEQMRGSLAKSIGDSDAAIEHMRRSQVDFEQALGKPTVYSWASAISVIEIELERAAAAGVRPSQSTAEHARAAYQAMLELSPPPSFDVFLAGGVLAETSAAMGETQQALAQFDEAISVGTTVYSADHPSVIDLRLKRAALLPAARDDEARSELQSIIDIDGLPPALMERARSADQTLRPGL